jgi:hypothetical protein
MDLPPLAIDIIKEAKTRYNSIPSIHYALENFTLILSKDIIQEHLVVCEYSKNAQFIALALMPEEGDSKNLFKNIDLFELNIHEVEFLNVSLDCIKNLCEKDLNDLYIPNNIKFATLLYLATYLDSSPNLIAKMIALSEQDMTVSEMIQLAIAPAGHRIFNNLVTKIFLNKDFSSYAENCLKQDENEKLREEDGVDVNNSREYINFKCFIGNITSRLKASEA